MVVLLINLTGLLEASLGWLGGYSGKNRPGVSKCSHSIGTISGLPYRNSMAIPFNVHKTNVDSTKLGKLVKDGLVMA